MTAFQLGLSWLLCNRLRACPRLFKSFPDVIILKACPHGDAFDLSTTGNLVLRVTKRRRTASRGPANASNTVVDMSNVARNAECRGRAAFCISEIRTAVVDRSNAFPVWTGLERLCCCGAVFLQVGPNPGDPLPPSTGGGPGVLCGSYCGPIAGARLRSCPHLCIPRRLVDHRRRRMTILVQSAGESPVLQPPLENLAKVAIQVFAIV